MPRALMSTSGKLSGPCLLGVAVALAVTSSVFLVAAGPAEAGTAGDIQTVVGTGAIGGSGDGGLATAATLGVPESVQTDQNGNLLIADAGNNRIRFVPSTACTCFGRSMAAGHIYTVAGTGTPGFSGDGGPATSAKLNYPERVVSDTTGNLIIADTSNERIRMVPSVSGFYYGQAMTADDIYTIAGTGTPGYSGDNGPGVSATLSDPEAVAVGTNTTTVWIADTANHVVRLLSPAGTIETAAGNGTAGAPTNGAVAWTTPLNAPESVAVDPVSSQVYIADTFNNQIDVIAADNSPDFGQAMVTNHIYTIASGVGLPEGIAVDRDRNVLVAETQSQRIAVVAATAGTYYDDALAAGALTTIAGTGTARFSGDGGPATAATISTPLDVGTDVAGDVFVADYGNDRIREISTFSGEQAVTTEVKPGGTINFGGTTATPESPLVESVKLPKRGPGAQLTISNLSPSEAAGLCGGQDCPGGVLELSAFSGYTNPKKPVSITFDIDVSVADQVGAIYWRVGTEPMMVEGQCQFIHGAVQTVPCIQKENTLPSGDLQVKEDTTSMPSDLGGNW